MSANPVARQWKKMNQKGDKGKVLTLIEPLDYFILREALQPKTNKNNQIEPAMEC